MIVVINPSGGRGHGFKGLHAYCAHDADGGVTDERVDWISTRNLSASPEHAYKVMIATADRADELKAANGIKTGRKTKQGPVLHIAMSFDEDEPFDRQTVEAAVDGLLGSLGADPATMRGKSKPKRRQFADEHQAVIYAHNDTKHRHVHIMVNTVHPETGLRLPTSNDQLKASKWAHSFAAEHGTHLKTPNRVFNQEARQNGEYVKADRRMPRNLYEQQKQAEETAQAMVRAEVEKIQDAQRKKDAAVYQAARNLQAMQAKALVDLKDQHEGRKASMRRSVDRELKKIAAQAREEFREPKIELAKRQVREAETFEAMESSFLGWAKNSAAAVREALQDEEERKSLIKRSFQILTSAEDRRAFFERGQQRERAALEAQERAKREAEELERKKAHEATLAANRQRFLDERAALETKQAEETAAMQARFEERKQDRELAQAKIDDMHRQAAEQKQAREAEAKQAPPNPYDATRLQGEALRRFNEVKGDRTEEARRRDLDQSDD
ncbi:MAG: relaxase/mobilization nuclease domain-containing protein [Pseudomonadota bacterium]